MPLTISGLNSGLQTEINQKTIKKLSIIRPKQDFVTRLFHF